MDCDRDCPTCRKDPEQRLDNPWSAARADAIVKRLDATYQDETGINHLDGMNLPQRADVLEALDILLEILFPGYTGRHACRRSGIHFAVGHQIETAYRILFEQAERALAYDCRLKCCDTCECPRHANQAVIDLLEKLPELREVLKDDVKAAMDGDPAARSHDEIVIAYPGLKAISIQRLAHELYLSQLPLIPRVLSEHAHALTGIDIHPGATIGRSFFIDHGTGVVIGETAVIGQNVKIYQGVTLGALSFPKDPSGKIIKGIKRHPNIEDNVTIYSGATILGDITIGHDSVIGGNVWITESVPPHSKVTVAPPELTIRTRGQR